jgi:hypothetical protein
MKSERRDCLAVGAAKDAGVSDQVATARNTALTRDFGYVRSLSRAKEIIERLLRPFFVAGDQPCI